MPSYRRAPRPQFEPLECRALFSTGPSPISAVRNVSRAPGNDAEAAIAVDRSNPNNLFAASNIGATDGLRTGVSADGGLTWTSGAVAVDGTDGLPIACCDPTAAFDSFGNLYVGYALAGEGEEEEGIQLILSTDGGRSFTPLVTFPGESDQPTVVTGPGSDGAPASVWVTYERDGEIVAAGAPVNGRGLVGPFTPELEVPGSRRGQFGDIAVGPNGQVMVTYQLASARKAIPVNVDPDGLGPAPFGGPVVATGTSVRKFQTIPAQRDRQVDAEAGLAYDRSTGPFRGRVYLLYTDRNPKTGFNTDILVRYSDDNGANWSAPARVNDDPGSNSQFLPRIALDDVTGTVGFSWHDARNDVGDNGPCDTNGRPNDDAELFAAIAIPTPAGVRLSPNVAVSGGVSNAAVSDSSVEFGDYTGLDFFNGTLHPAWADNSNFTTDNPDGRLDTFDLYAARLTAAAFPPPGPVWLSGLPNPGLGGAPLPQLGGTGTIRGGRSYRFTVALRDPEGGTVDTSRLANGNLLVAGPNGFNAPAQFVRARTRRGVTTVSYQVFAPGRRFTAADNGNHTVSLLPNQFGDAEGHFTPEGILGTFVVAAR